MEQNSCGSPYHKVIWMKSGLYLTKLFLIMGIALLIASCGGGDGSKSVNISSTTPEINQTAKDYGVAQKGPFLADSQITLSKLDNSGASNGEVVTTKVVEKSGKFEFQIPDSWNINNKDTAEKNKAYMQLEAKGQVFDESTIVSASAPANSHSQTAKLTAITSDAGKASINLLTHFVVSRVEVLVANGKNISTVKEQAEKELGEIFGIANANALDITRTPSENSADSALLFLLSGAMMEVANKNGVALQTIIDDFSNDFADDGLISALGNDWFKRMQARVRNNPAYILDGYSRNLKRQLNGDTPSGINLPESIPLASRPVAVLPEKIYAVTGETIVLNGGESHDSGSGVINSTWFRVDQQQQYVVPLSDRFSLTPSITVPGQECELLFALVVTDGEKLTDTAVVKIIVRDPLPENKAPVANPQVDDQAVVTNEDTPIDITLTGSDPDRDTIKFIISTPLLLPNGLLEGSAPNLVYTPSPNFTGADHFTFQVDDGSLMSEVARVDIIVLPVNDPPLADDKTVITDEDTPVNIALSGSDIENDPLTFSIGPMLTSNGILTASPPTVVYTPNSNFLGNDSFEYIANDGSDDSQPATVNIIVNPVNDPPIANPQNVVTNEDTPVNITLTGSDPEVDTLSFNLVGITVQNGTLTGTPPNLAYVPHLDFNGDDSFNFTVNDGTDNSQPVTVNIIVNPVNDPPLADDKTVITDEDTPVNIALSGSDIENDPLTFSIGPGLSTNGILTGIPPMVVYTPNSNFFGNDSFTYITNDGSDDSQPATVTIIVNPVNDPPIANPQNVVTNEDTAVNITLTGSDIEADPLSFNLGGITVQNGSLSGALPNLTYLPDTDFNGFDSFSFSVNDGTDNSSQATVNIQVLPVDDNLPPTAQDLTIPFDPSNPIIIQLLGDDPDGINANLIYTIVADPGNGSLDQTNIATGEVEYSPDSLGSNPPADDSFTYRVQDEDGLFSGEATVNLVMPNTPPTAIATFNGTEPFGTGTTVVLFGGESFDVDGNIVTYFWEQIGTPLVMLSDSNAANPTFTAPSLPAGVTAPLILTFRLTVTDDDDATDSAQVTVEITDQIPPIADAGQDQILPFLGEAGSADLDGSNSNDPDGSILTYSWELLPLSTYSSISIYEDGIYYDPDDTTTPGAGFSVNSRGTATFRLTVTDDDGLSDTDDVTIIFQGTPYADDILLCYDSETYTDLTITLSGVDPDATTTPPILRYKILTLPSPGSLNVGTGELPTNTNTVVYTPVDVGGSPDVVTFTYSVIDEQGWESFEATVGLFPDYGTVCPY